MGYDTFPSITVTINGVSVWVISILPWFCSTMLRTEATGSAGGCLAYIA